MTKYSEPFIEKEEYKKYPWFIKWYLIWEQEWTKNDSSSKITCDKDRPYIKRYEAWGGEFLITGLVMRFSVF